MTDKKLRKNGDVTITIPRELVEALAVFLEDDLYFLANIFSSEEVREDGMAMVEATAKVNAYLQLFALLGDKQKVKDVIDYCQQTVLQLQKGA